jgi:DNA-binding response OmpR family regulator
MNSQTAKPKLNIAPDEMNPLKGKNCLLVDTALPARRALQEQLSQLGAKSVLFASSVTEVEQVLNTRELTLIICEYQLDGERNGQQLLEDLRINKKLHWSTAFMMVTGERSYTSVIAVAEFEPDDYLIKPFTASTLADRVVRIFGRKNKLQQAYKAMYEEQYAEVPSICDRLAHEHPSHGQELKRLKIEANLRAGQLDNAEELLQAYMCEHPKPWMNLFMAKVEIERKDLGNATNLLQQVVKENPEYMAATDLYADVLWEQNKPNEALEVLEGMGPKGLSSTTRLRKLADLSVRIGDNFRSKKYLTRVIDRSRNSALSQMHDYLQLSKIYIAEGKNDEAEKLAAKLRSNVSSGELDLARSLMSIQRDIVEGCMVKAREKLGFFFTNNAPIMDNLEAETLTSLLEMCFAVTMQSKGYELASQITKQKPSKAVLDRIRSSIETAKIEAAKQQAQPSP